MMNGFRRMADKLIAATVSSRPVLRIYDRHPLSAGARRAIAWLLSWIGLSRLLFGVLHRGRAAEKGIAAVAIVKDEGPYLKEWVRYHKSLGIERFYLFDNESAEPAERVLAEEVAAGLVVCQTLRGKLRQIDAYNIALRKYGRAHRYFAVIDLDEFIFPTDGGRLEPLLDAFFQNGRAGGCAVNWALFGSSGYKEKPQGLVTRTYLHRGSRDFEKNRHIKTICMPSRVWGFLNPHYAVYRGRYSAFTFAGERVRGAFTQKTDWSVLRVNHYFTKSYAEFLQKRLRGKADNEESRALSEFGEHDANEEYDDGMLSLPYDV